MVAAKGGTDGVLRQGEDTGCRRGPTQERRNQLAEVLRIALFLTLAAPPELDDKDLPEVEESPSARP